MICPKESSTHNFGRQESHIGWDFGVGMKDHQVPNMDGGRAMEVRSPRAWIVALIGVVNPRRLWIHSNVKKTQNKSGRSRCAHGHR
jgi:hypothetical protein